MLSSTRIANHFRIQRPLLALSDRRSISKLKLSTLPTFSSAEVSWCPDEDCDDFLPWLEGKVGVEISSVLSIGKSAYGRSLIASKSIHTGDCMLKVPHSVQIAPDNLLPEINSLLTAEVGNVAKLAIVILVEQKMGQHSEWAPYISRLPQPGEMHNAIFWSKRELEMIRQSSVYEETVKKNAHIEKEFLAVKQAFDCFSEIFDGTTFDVFRHAYALVESRAWRSTRGVSLIPFADFLNHDGAAEAIVLSDEDKELSEYFSPLRLPLNQCPVTSIQVLQPTTEVSLLEAFIPRATSVEVIADRDYAPGDQVMIRYGKFSNGTLLLDFGFTLSYNTYDEFPTSLATTLYLSKKVYGDVENGELLMGLSVLENEMFLKQWIVSTMAVKSDLIANGDKEEVAVLMEDWFLNEIDGSEVVDDVGEEIDRMGVVKI
ncbi:hypothetical protein U1Q18_022080 [Sarracenia purpurea var. burkii]